MDDEAEDQDTSESLPNNLPDNARAEERNDMTAEQALVTAVVNSWKFNIERANKLFSPLSEEQLLKEVAPGKNRLIYLWGHLTAVHDRMLPLLALGPRLLSGIRCPLPYQSR